VIHRVFGLIACTLALTSCSAPNKPATFILTEAPWADRAGGTVLTSDHWRIATTVPDSDRRKLIASTLESAFDAYRSFVPSTPEHDKPLSAFIFIKRSEWAKFTSENTPEESAKLYLQIVRGGYAHDDFFVAYDFAALDTLTVIAHEGWHVFARRYFKRPLPPFLEEGIAASFESVSIEGDHASVSTERTNASLKRRLADVIAKDQLMSLSDALKLSASSLLDRGVSPEAFYAQGWALVRFFRVGEDNRYREPFAQMLADRVTGIGPTAAIDDPVKLLESFTDQSIIELDKQYQAFVRKITRENASTSW